MSESRAHAAMSDGYGLAPSIDCRFCGARLERSFIDLGLSPLCQTQIHPERLDEGEVFYPLHVWVCDQCFLVQLGEYVKPEAIFGAEYPYYSSYSVSWVEHARRYAQHMMHDHGIDRDSFVVEIASNDGYLLQHFVAENVRCLGVEPAAGVAQVAMSKGVQTVSRFFGTETASALSAEHGKADLMLGNNVLAHVPELNDFVHGLEVMLAPDGIITMEFPHLLKLIEFNQFDTIYHEHFSYFSFTTVQKVFKHHGLKIFSVEELPTHGGSLRIYAAHEDSGAHLVTEAVPELLRREEEIGFTSIDFYSGFEPRARETKRKLLDFLIKARRESKTIVGYGAPGKGNTLLNYCGIRRDFLDYTVDRNPHKQGTYTPGTRIPILDPAAIFETQPDYILILPWNLREEIVRSMASVREWGGRFVVPIPEVEVLAWE